MMRAWLPDAFLMETLNPVDLDPRALAAASLSGLAATIGAGLLPAWIGTRVHPAGAGAEVSAVSRNATESRVARAFTRGLLVVEVALTCALLVGTSLLVTSFVRLANVDRGLDTRGVMTAWVRLTAPASEAPAGIDAVKDAVAGMPGVETVSISQSAPPRGGLIHFGCCWVPDTPGAQPLDLVVDGYLVDNGALALYRIPILQGRPFRDDEPETSVILGERLAQLLFPDGNAVGRSFKRDEERFDVVGVARELRYPSLDRMSDVPEYYRPSGPLGSQVNVNVRCQGPCPSVAALRQRLESLPEVREIYRAGLMDEAYAEELSRPRAAATMAVLFTGIAVIAACGGLFSVLSYAVGRRRREFGIRVSLGAAPSQVQRLVFREGLRLAIAGAVLGSFVAWLISRALASVVYEVSAAEPVIWVTVAIIVALTTLAASWVPARRAARIDPAVLLRD
jgi:putative ABC transport system permease protein